MVGQLLQDADFSILTDLRVVDKWQFADQHHEDDCSPTDERFVMSPRPKRSQEEAERRLGSYLRELRRALGLTQRQVREATGDLVGESYLSQLETGRIVDPSPSVLFELSKIYEVEYWDLMGRA